jgi:tRNA A-37 threonylcarbamoyl transferase component Bud32
VSGERLPAGYEAVRPPGVEAFAWAAATGWLALALRDGPTLHEWAERHATDSHAGRGPVHLVAAALPGPDESPRWAVRHYRRGGAAAPLLGDRYWKAGRTRPERELEASLHARSRGVRTPAVIAGAVYRAGSSAVAGLYRADLVTEWVPGARSLANVLSDAGGHATDALLRAGGAVRALERAGVMHPDLNAGNIVLDVRDDAWVLDLDRCRRLRHPSARAGAAMLRRLERSLRKLAPTRGRPLSREERGALRAGFEGPE